jgi:hypothetical protein
VSVLDDQGMVRQPLPPAPRIEWTPPPNRRRFILRAIAVAVVLALIGGGIGWLRYIHTYQPLEWAGVSYYIGPNLTSLTDGIDTTGFIATGPAGSVTTYRTSIHNSGRFDVRLLGLDHDTTLAKTIRWHLVGPDGSEAAAMNTPGTTGPVTLHPGQIVEVEIDFVRPRCHGGEGLEVFATNIRWSALGVQHTYAIDISNGVAPGAALNLCYPKSALRHLAYPATKLSY